MVEDIEMTFEEALEAVIENAINSGLTIDFTDAEINMEEGTLYLPNYAEIMPISMSSKNCITWYGQKFKIENNN